MTPTSAAEPAYATVPGCASAPAWFREHTAIAPAPRQLRVGGAWVRYLDWRPVAQRRETLLFVHGGAANAQWWAPLAPFFARDGHRVVAMDLTGMGLSEWRPSYDVQGWARDVVAVGSHLRTARHPVALVAHSLGGIIGAHAVVEHGTTFSRFLAVDSPVWNHAPEPGVPVGDQADAPVRYYADPEVAIRRFALLPPQVIRNPWYVRHVAWHGLGLTEQGWTWRFDRRIFEQARGTNRIARFEGDLADAGCPTTVVMGEDSYLTASAREHGPIELVPRAQHHVMLDEPLALVATLRRLLD